MSKRTMWALAIAWGLAMTAPMTAAADQGTVQRGPVIDRPPQAKEMNAWVDWFARINEGRVSRQVYFYELGRRWDDADRRRQGLTPSEIQRLTGAAAGAEVRASHVRDPQTRDD